MQISRLSYVSFINNRERIAPQQSPSAPSAAPEAKTAPSKVEVLQAEADAKKAHLNELDSQELRIIHGETIAPEDRLPLEGVSAQSLKSMNDKEYLQALMDEQSRYVHEASALNNQLMALVFPADADRYLGKGDIKPEMSMADAKSALNSYVGNVSDSIKGRAQLVTYLQSDKAWDYLVGRYGEEGAKEDRVRTQDQIDVFDAHIKTALTSLNIIFSLDPKSVASYDNGTWTFHGGSGQYSSGGNSLQFTIGEDGSIVTQEGRQGSTS